MTSIPSLQDHSRPLISVAMLGARMHFAVPVILAEAGLLHTLYTDVYVGNKAWLERIMSLVPGIVRPKFLEQLCGRSERRIPRNKIVSFDLLGLWYSLKRRRNPSSIAAPSVFAKMNRLFGNRVVNSGLDGTNIVWGFNGASLEIFQYASSHGIGCILEQSIAPRRIELQLLAEESRTWPGWQPKNGEPFPPESDPLAEREEAEWALADKIICGSDFVADSLRERNVPSDKLHVVPYGVDATSFQPSARQSPPGELNVLFVGEVGLRKGIPYLLEALKALNRPQTVHARLVGPISVSSERLESFQQWCEVLGPMPRSRIVEMYQWADVLVLPALCEGSATVTYEALSCGIPIITTRNSGSIVRDGIEGFVVEIRDIAGLRDKLSLLADDDRRRLKMARAATERATQASLAAYSERLLKVFLAR